MASSDKKRGLGRGLSALMADVTEAEQSPASSTRQADTLPIERVFPNADQPRKQFTQDELDDLAASIKERGILQPLIVREKGDGYEIVAGERRWRAAQLASLHEVPVRIRNFTDTEVLEVAIVENVQRADLNPIEEAAGYQMLMERFGHTQDKVATALGKSRSHIANLLRLLQLPKEVRDFVVSGDLTAGHARALITSDDPVGLARRVIKDGLSVRATEALVKSEGKPAAPKAPRAAVVKDADTRALEGDLSAALGLKVEIAHKPGSDAGTLSLSYTNLDQLDDLMRRLTTD